jgi:DNA-binding Lrp family transcriptional regulator
MEKKIRLTESALQKIVKESVKRVLNESINRTYIVHNGIDLILSMNGEDMFIEYTENNRWVLACYDAREKSWVVQENLDEDGENDIIVIARTKSMPEALEKLTLYIRNLNGHKTRQI